MRSLTLKLILAFLAVSLTGAALVAVFAVLITANQFSQFVANRNQEDIVDQFAAYYRLNGEWAGVAETYASAYRSGFRGQGLGGQPGRGPGPPGDVIPLVLIDSRGHVVIGGLGYSVGEQIPARAHDQATPIEVDGQEVGRLLLGRDLLTRRLAGAETVFLARVNQALILGALGATLIALLLGILLARTLTRPLRELTAATRAVAQGDLGQEVPVRSQDELGELAASFNQMSADLVHSRDLRRQMTADIAHDLRTPLSVILGHSEALSDGVLPPSSTTFHVIHDEARRLSRLVEDLRVLSLAEAGELQLTRRLVSPEVLLSRAATAHGPAAKQQAVNLELETTQELPDVYVDPDRIAQVMDNLLNNALRYTPEGGSIRLSARPGLDGSQLVVQDSGPGIAAEELPYIFERFYRGDRSRQRHEGGSGLGLAIARSIVEAHGGRIWAESEPGRGVTFVIELPVRPQE